MKTQISRLSPHQNAKVFAVLFALGSLVFVVPFTLLALLTAPKENSPPVFFFLLFPLLYLVLGYIMVVVSCAFYNYLFKFIGGLEFESRSAEA